MIVREQGGIAFALIELNGFVAATDARLAALAGLPRAPTVLGAYAIPEETP